MFLPVGVMTNLINGIPGTFESMQWIGLVNVCDGVYDFFFKFQVDWPRPLLKPQNRNSSYYRPNEWLDVRGWGFGCNTCGYGGGLNNLSAYKGEF